MASCLLRECLQVWGSLRYLWLSFQSVVSGRSRLGWLAQTVRTSFARGRHQAIEHWPFTPTLNATATSYAFLSLRVYHRYLRQSLKHTPNTPTLLTVLSLQLSAYSAKHWTLHLTYTQATCSSSSSHSASTTLCDGTPGRERRRPQISLCSDRSIQPQRSCCLRLPY